MQSLVEGCPVMCQLLKEELMKKKIENYTPFIINVHRRRLWKADFSLATLAKGPHLVLCFLMVANNVNAPTANRSAFFQNFITLRI
jgi:hypothetical protein